MSEQKPFRVETTIDAPTEVVWRAFTDPELIREWFGWDYEEIGAEIRLIFVDQARPLPPDRILLDGDQEIRLEPDGHRTTVRVTMAGGLAGAEWDDIYDGMEEGWRAFFEQLRFLLERKPGPGRRTLYLTGAARPQEVLASVGQGVAWHRSRYQMMVVDERGHLAAFGAQQPIDHPREPGPVAVTVSTYGLDDTSFDELRAAWTTRWQRLVAEPAVTS